MPRKEDKLREKRIEMEIVVDRYNEEERALGDTEPNHFAVLFLSVVGSLAVTG